MPNERTNETPRCLTVSREDSSSAEEAHYAGRIRNSVDEVDNRGPPRDTGSRHTVYRTPSGMPRACDRPRRAACRFARLPAPILSFCPASRNPSGFLSTFSPFFSISSSTVVFSLPVYLVRRVAMGRSLIKLQREKIGNFERRKRRNKQNDPSKKRPAERFKVNDYEDEGGGRKRREWRNKKKPVEGERAEDEEVRRASCCPNLPLRRDLVLGRNYFR